MPLVSVNNRTPALILPVAFGDKGGMSLMLYLFSCPVPWSPRNCYLDLVSFPKAGVDVLCMTAIVGMSGGDAVTVNMCWLTTADELDVVGFRVDVLGGASWPFQGLECMKQ